MVCVNFLKIGNHFSQPQAFAPELVSKLDSFNRSIESGIVCIIHYMYRETIKKAKYVDMSTGCLSDLIGQTSDRSIDYM